MQPPSGGCVLKQGLCGQCRQQYAAAAFGRLCVETFPYRLVGGLKNAAAFGRLCVETIMLNLTMVFLWQPPSGGCVLKPAAIARLGFRPSQPPSGGCVLKQDLETHEFLYPEAAAFGRLCVETQPIKPIIATNAQQPPSGGCVLKHHRDGRRRGYAGQPPSGGCVLKLLYYILTV